MTCAPHSVEILRELGYRVLEAPNGQAALEMLDRQPEVALLFTDVGLPGGMNGRQLAEEARRRRPGLKVLFTTGYARNAIVHDGRLDPGVELITKPFSYPQLAAKLARSARRRWPGAARAGGRGRGAGPHGGGRLAQGPRLPGRAGGVGNRGDRQDARPGRPASTPRSSMSSLPDRKGDVLAAELRAMSAELPIVVTSGYPREGVRVRFDGDRFVGFVGKPYDREGLELALRALGVEALAS